MITIPWFNYNTPSTTHLFVQTNLLNDKLSKTGKCKTNFWHTVYTNVFEFFKFMDNIFFCIFMSLYEKWLDTQYGVGYAVGGGSQNQTINYYKTTARL